jgi:hypothetical protein
MWSNVALTVCISAVVGCSVFVLDWLPTAWSMFTLIVGAAMVGGGFVLMAIGGDDAWWRFVVALGLVMVGSLAVSTARKARRRMSPRT